MKYNNTKKGTINTGSLAIDWNTCTADAGSFPTEFGTFSGSFISASAKNENGDNYRIVWTNIDLEAFAEDGADGADWNKPDYILDDCGHCYTCQN